MECDPGHRSLTVVWSKVRASQGTRAHASGQPIEGPFPRQHHEPPGFRGDPYWEGAYSDQDGISSLSDQIGAQGWN